MKRKIFWLAGTLVGVAVGALLASTAHADNGNVPGKRFIGRDSRIEGCIAIMDKVRDGTISPTEWMEQNREEFGDLQIELKKRRYKPEAAKQMLMGLAINMCMENKGYYNKCAVDADSDTEDGDLQLMQTADRYACWSKGRRADRPSPTPPMPPPPMPPPPMPCGIASCGGPPQAGPVLPPMSPADLNQYNEDVSIISQPVRFIGDDEGGAKEARFGSCFSYWQSLSYNRSPEARQVLYAVRVARCMYRTNYAVLHSRCSHSFGSMLSTRCYARFAS